MGHAVVVSPALKAAFVLLLVLSVGGKVVITNQWPPSAGPTGLSGAEADAVAAFFGRHGFRVGEVRGTEDPPSVRATAGACELLAMLVAPNGSQRSLVRQLASGRDRVLFVFDAVAY